jgi:hypothetical protein
VTFPAPRLPGWTSAYLDRQSTRWCLLLAASFLAACQGDPPPPPIRRLAPRLTERLTRGRAELPDGERRSNETGVYLDGKPLGVLRHSELPPSLPRRSQRLEDGRDVPRFRVVEYLTSVGVPVERLRAAHFHGGRGRASIVSGEELRKHPETLLFSFNRGDGGKPRMHWPEEGIAVNTTIDTLGALTLYVEREPPAFDRKAHTFSFDGGPPIEGIPYAQGEEPLKGTRVYVDGLLVASMRRRALAPTLALPGTDPQNPRYSLAAWIASLPVAAPQPKAVELIAGDDVVTRLSAEQWAREQGELSFSLPRRSQGKILIHLPTSDPAVAAAPPGSAPDPAIKLTAIQIYVKSDPRGGPLRPLPELLAEAGGSSNDQGGGEKRRNGGGSGTARTLHNDRGEEGD